MLLAVAACATPPPDSDPEAKAEFTQTDDPLEPLNRVVFTFDGALDLGVLRPAAIGYRAVVPAFGRARIADFLSNLRGPLTAANDMLQGNFALAGETARRFLLNSTFGVLGIMDVAKPMGLQPHDSDFGQTLGVWGIGPGPYLMLPVFGFSDARDAAGLGVDFVTDPFNFYWAKHAEGDRAVIRYGVLVLTKREQYLDAADQVRRESLDPYATLRSLYRQRRAALVEGAKPSPPAGPEPKSAP